MTKNVKFLFVEKILKKHARSDLLVLDIGCGRAAYKDLFTKFVGIDLPLNSFFEFRDIDVYCSGEDLSFSNETFNLVFMVNTLLVIPDANKVLQEAERVLKPKGKIIIFDYNLKTTRKLYNAYEDHYHIWSPFSLARKVSRVGLKASIIYDYHILEHSKNWQRPLLKVRIGKYLKFLYHQTKESIIIVMGEKK